MSYDTPNVVQCIVDDTALTANIAEIETWVARGAIVLVLPLYTLDRLHLLKKDASPIGQNARRTVKFLDKMTSGKVDLPHEPIIIQGPDEQYATWQEVEAHYSDNITPVATPKKSTHNGETDTKNDVASKRTSGTALSQILLDKLNFGAPQATSPGSTPPMSPSSSEPQSTKTSPEVRPANVAIAEKSPVPPILKPLLNPVVWYAHEKKQGSTEVFFLTNSADTQHLARDFSVPTKTIHQLRSTIGLDAVQLVQTTVQTTSPSSNEPEKKTLFSYDDESDEEEVVFKPRGRGAVRAVANNRGSIRGKANRGRSPRLTYSTVVPTADTKGGSSATPKTPRIPIEEIDPDSFDRGSFGRGTGQLAPVGNRIPPPSGPTRVSGTSRGGFSASTGRGYPRGRGGERGGSLRGRGRLFVP